MVLRDVAIITDYFISKFFLSEHAQVFPRQHPQQRHCCFNRSSVAERRRQRAAAEEGAALVERCNRILDDASNRVSRIVERDGSFTEEPFGDGDE